MGYQRRILPLGGILLFVFSPAFSQETLRPKDVRNLGKQGSSALPRLTELLRNPDLEIRVEAVKAITEVGTQASLAPLIQATADNDPEVQIRATILEALHSKNTEVIYESLNALQKIRDESAAAGVAFLTHDLDQKVQIAAIETVGLLQNTSSVPELLDVLEHSKINKVKRAALTALAMLPDEQSRSVYLRYLHDKDDGLRAAAAEGLGRLQKPSDLPLLEQAFNEEGKTSPRLALAFAQVMLGKSDISEFSPFQLIINNLNSAAWKGVVYAYLVELARNPALRPALYNALDKGTKEEKIYLARVLARSGGQDAVPYLEKVSHDDDGEVAQEGLRALRTLKARL